MRLFKEEALLRTILDKKDIKELTELVQERLNLVKSLLKAKVKFQHYELSDKDSEYLEHLKSLKKKITKGGINGKK